MSFKYVFFTNECLPVVAGFVWVMALLRGDGEIARVGWFGLLALVFCRFFFGE